MQFSFREYSLDTDRRELSRGSTPIAVEPQVFDLLAYLVQHRDRVVTKDDLLEAVWGGRTVSGSALTTRINAARRAIGDTGEAQRLIRTLPRKGVRFIAEVKEKVTSLDFAALQRAAEFSEKPSIVVLPFQKLSDDPELEYFADGLVEEIVTALSRIGWLFVISGNSTLTYKGQAIDVKRVGRELGVRYVLEGSVRKAGGRVRITGQLIDAITGTHLWVDRFDGTLEDIFELQDKVALSVAGVIEPTLQAAEIRRSGNRPTNDLSAYDLYLRALPHVFSQERDGYALALDLLGRAIERDPHYGTALAHAAYCHVGLYDNGWTDDHETNRRTSIDLARRSLRSGPDDPDVLAIAAFVLGRSGEDIDAAVGLIDRCLALNPSFARGWHWSGVLRNYAGHPDLALEHLNMSLRLSPRDRLGFHLTPIGGALFFMRRFEEAAAKLVASLEQMPTFAVTYRFLASCYAHMGRLEEAREIVTRLRAITSVVVPKATPYRKPEHRELFLSGLRLAAGEVK